MRAFVPAFAGALMFAAASASAASLCNCCSSGTAEACTATCATVKPAEGMCIPAVDFAGSAKIGAGQNPLYDVPLKGLNITGASRSDLESFRRLLEKSRMGAERDRRLALRDLRHRRIDAAAAASAAKRYDDAIVNYFLGMYAYRDAVNK